MKRTIIALIATAALATPAGAQQQDPNQNTSQNQSTGQDQNAGRDAPDPSMADKGAQSRSITLTRAQTRMLQQSLNSGGLNAGPVDGIMGAKTRDALQKYQSQNGLNASGQVDRQTLAALLSERNKRTASRKGSGHGMSTKPQNQGQQSGGQ